MRHSVLALSLAMAAWAEDPLPRRTYNDAVRALGKGDVEAAQKGFLAARDRAGADAVLRYRAAFNLGLAYAKKADEAKAPEEKVEALGQAAAWFRDAVRIDPADEDSRVNLEIVLGRIRALADELNKGKNGLEARLDHLIEDQRGLRDGARQLMARVEAAKTEPIRFQDDFHAAATQQRTLLAEAGSVYDMAANEADKIAVKKKEEQTPEEQTRGFQLLALREHLDRARQSMAETRRALRDLNGTSAIEKTNAAVHELVRAREQLLDPATILQGLAQEQALLGAQTAGLSAVQKGTLRLESGEKAEAPAWLNPSMLAGGERELTERTRELEERFAGAVGQDPSQLEEPQKQLLETIERALPSLGQAASAMASAATVLDGANLDDALRDQGRALEALLLALEQFAGIRQLIELAYADQSAAAALVSPEKQDPSAPKLSAKEHAAQLGSTAERNRQRLARLKVLFEQEAQGVKEDDPKAEQQRALFQVAEEKRADADAALVRMALHTKGDAELPAAVEEGRARLEDLRRLFFSLVEHLKQLARDQGDTHDQTAATQALADETRRKSEEARLADAEQRHGAVADQLSRALEEQSNQAAAGEDAKGKDATQVLSQAAAEVHSATSKMQEAASGLAIAAKEQETSDLEPILAAQQEALQHVGAAIALLEPPKPQQGQDQNDQQDQQQQQPEPSREQAARRLQAIRDREAERQRERRERAAPGSEPVEKDW